MSITKWTSMLKAETEKAMAAAGIEGEVFVKTYTKSNDREVRTISIRTNEGAVSPAIPIQRLWDNFEEGACMEELAKDVIDSSLEAWNSEVPPNELFTEYDKVKQFLRVKILDKKYNKCYLAGCMHLEFPSGLVLAPELRYPIESEADEGGHWSITITNEMAKLQNYDKDETMNQAIKNTVEDEEPMLFALSKGFAADHPETIEIGAEMDREEAYVLTTTYHRFGATFLLTRPDIFEAIRQEYGDFWILPSSRHELIFVSKDSVNKLDKLKQTVRNANNTVVSKEDFLSNDVFEYTENGLSRAV